QTICCDAVQLDLTIKRQVVVKTPLPNHNDKHRHVHHEPSVYISPGSTVSMLQPGRGNNRRYQTVCPVLGPTDQSASGTRAHRVLSSGCEYLPHYTTNESRKLESLRVGVYTQELAT
ncbi:MAG: hypothetical protein ACKPKO_13440, partial [Candidatus Fonsibacter sp.]